MAKATASTGTPRAASARRRQALENRSAVHPLVDVVPAGPATRLALRAPDASRDALGKVLGLALPTRPKTSASVGARAALWLGPDEWLVIDTDERDMVLACAGVAAFHSAVDVSHRNVGIVVSGAGAEATLAAGCPQDLSLDVFPVGAASRTVLGKIEVVIWRTAETEFRVECWRSFSDYAFTFLSEAARDVAA